MSFIPINGQLAASSGSIVAARATSRRLNIALYNTSASTTETVALSVTPAGGTSRQMTRIVLLPNESAMVEGVYLDPSDVLSGSSSNATTTNYSIQPSSDNAPFRVSLFSSTGAAKSSTTALLPAAKFTTTAAASPLTAAAGDLSGANLTVFQVTTAGAFALTTRTATEMFADIPNCTVGMSYLLRIVSQGDNTVTVTGGTGVTITGTATVATKVTRDFVVTFTSATACTLQGVSKGTIE